MKKLLFIPLLLISNMLLSQDNIVTEGCFTDAPKSTWGIKPAWTSKDDVKVCRPWLVGNLDNDEFPEIVAVSDELRVNSEVYTKLIVFPGSATNAGRDKAIRINTVPYGSYRSIALTGLISVGGQKLIVVTGTDGFLYAYSYMKAKTNNSEANSRVWKSAEKVVTPVANATNPFNNAPGILFTNFNIPGSETQIYSGGKLINALNGKTLATMPAGNRALSPQNDAKFGAEFPATANIDGEQLLILGNQAYGISGTNFVKKKSVAAPSGFLADGHVSIADFNGDQSSDALISVVKTNGTNTNGAKVQMYGWDIKNQKILFTYEIEGSSKSIPFIGDIDGDGKVEILLITQADGKTGYLTALKLPAKLTAAEELVKKWDKAVIEGAGRTGITLFDFNLDGTAEIVYRDEQKLYIINGSGSTPVIMKDYISTSATTWEYPIVADIDNDGAAEIICAGGTENNRPGVGKMVVFKADVDRWAPARPVWNQYAYNSTNVNKDLTIGSRSLNPAKIYPGKNGKKVAPFNAFLQQQTLLNTDGNPYSPSPSADIQTTTSIAYDAAGDKLVVTVVIKNSGKLALASPIKVTAYKNNIGNATKYTHTQNQSIAAGATGTFSFNIANFKKTWGTVANVFINVNDGGDNKPAQTVCSTSKPSTSRVPILITATATNPKCSTGKGSITVAGAPAGTSYSINGGTTWQTTTTFSDLAAGTYTISAKNGTTSTATVKATIVIPKLVTVSATSANATCNGKTGTITVTSAGGTGAKKYRIYKGSAWLDWQTSNVFTMVAGDYKVQAKDANECASSASGVIKITQPAAITVTAPTIENVKCKGGATGSVDIKAATGGTGALQYRFYDGATWTAWGVIKKITGLTAKTTYKIEVKDANGCTASKAVTITEPATNITIANPVLVHVKCKGASTGSVDIKASTGGTGALQYRFYDGATWSAWGAVSKITGLGAKTTYKIEVKDANGCTASKAVTITEPATNITIANPVLVHVKCKGASTGSVDIKASTGGTGALQYRFYDGATWTAWGAVSKITGLGAKTTYKIEVKDANGCTASKAVTITEPAAITVTAPTIENVKCKGGTTGSVDIKAATGGTGALQYRFYDGATWTAWGAVSKITGLGAKTTYKIEVKDANGCTASRAVTITEPTAITVTAPTIENVKCKGGATGSVDIKAATGGTGTLQYRFYDGATWSAWGVIKKITGLTAKTTYKIEVKDANGCTASKAVTITEPATNITIANPVLVHVKCKGASTGSVDIKASTGGTGALQYRFYDGATWSAWGAVSKITGLGAKTTYKIEVKDANGCVASKAVTITEPATNITIANPVLVHVKCKGASTGSVDIKASTGGTGALQYRFYDGATWSAWGAVSKITGLGAKTTYKIEVKDANGCVASKAVTITEPATNITIANPVLVHVKCKGASTGSVDIKASTGGTGALQYRFYDGATWTAWGAVSKITGLGAKTTYKIEVKDANGCTASKAVTITEPAAITVTAPTIENVKCKGGTTGSVDIKAATGGTGTLQYRFYDGATWSAWGAVSKITGLGAKTTYKIEVKDANGCTASRAVTITEPTAITVTAPTIENVKCKGGATGSVDIKAATGGTGTLQYRFYDGATWSAWGAVSKITGLGAKTTYKIEVKDANGCTASKAVTITEPTAITVTAPTIENVKCKGGATGSVDIKAATGGTGALQYRFYDGATWTAWGVIKKITGLTAKTTYKIEVKDANGCTASRAVTITEPTAITVTAPTIENVKCKGGATGSVDIKAATGGTGTLQYRFYDGATWSAWGAVSKITGLGAKTTYKIEVKDANGCTASKAVTITEPTAITVTAPTIENVKCKGGATGSVDIKAATGGTGALQYRFYDGATWTAWGVIKKITGLTAKTTYKIEVKDANGCTASRAVTITEPTAITVTAPTIENVKCKGGATGSVDIKAATGGTGTLQYRFYDGATWSAWGAVSKITGLGAKTTYKIEVKDANGCTASKAVTITEPTAITVTAPTIENVKCKGGATGSVDIKAATGGTGTLQYRFYDGATWTAWGAVSKITGLGAKTTYKIEVKDANGCTASRAVTITEPTAITVTAPTIENVKCKGGATGSVDIKAATGGTGALQYRFYDGATWSAWGAVSKITGLTAKTTYKIEVKDANGCVASKAVTITEPATNITIANPVLVHVKCKGASTGSVDIKASTGGTGALQYRFYDGATWTAWGAVSKITGLGAKTTYKIEVKDANGCTASKAVTITEPATNITIANPVLVHVKCKGASTGSVDIKAATGGTGALQYRFYDGATWTAWGAVSKITGLGAKTTYKIEVKDANGCVASKTVAITEPSAVTFTLAQSPETCLENDGKITISGVAGGTGAYTYKVGDSEWKTISGTATVTGLSAKAHSVSVKDANGCTISKNISVTSSGKSPSGFVKTAPKAFINDAGDLIIQSEIKNVGSAKFKKPFKFTVYKNNLGDSKKEIGLYSEDIEKGASAIVSVTIPNFRNNWTSCDKVVLNFNDGGVGSRDQVVCTDAERKYILAISDMVDAKKDSAFVFKCGIVDIDVLANDNNVTSTPTIIKQGKYGTAIVNANKTIKYTNTGGSKACNLTGGTVDTLVYEVCNTSTGSCAQSQVLVYILNTPEIVLFDSCSFQPYMALSISHTDIVCKWEFMKEGTSTWTVLSETSSKCTEVSSGKYKVTVTKSNDISKAIFTTSPKTIISVETLVCNKKWYRVQSE